MLKFFRKHYGTHTRGVVAAALATAVAAFAEASVLVMLAPLAERASRRAGEVTGEIGPLEIELSTERVLALVVALILLSTAAKAVALWLRTRTGRSWELRERVRALRALLEADYEYTARLSPGELQAMVGGHISQAAAGLHIIGTLVNAAISSIILMAVAFVTSPVAAIVIAAAGGLLLASLRPLARRTRNAGKESSTLEVEAGRLVSDTARDAREIRLYGAEERFLERYRVATAAASATRRRISMTSGLAPIFYQGSGLLLIVLALSLAISISDIEVTTLGAVALLFLRSLGYGQQLSTAQQQYNQVVPFVDDLDQRLDGLRAAAAAYGSTPLERVDHIRLEGVSYRYPEQESMALDGVDLELPSPGRVGLVGPSGSGKSTLAQLLLRLRKPTAGSVLVNGVDVQEFAAQAWTQQVAFVPQYPQLMRGTVRENLAFFRDDVTEADMDHVVASVGLDALFSSFPEGYDTPLGETSRELSGGQLQRLGIARALLGKPSLIVLDEPTSALDAETEEWVQRALRVASRQALVVIITHRSSTLGVCDRIITMRHGRITDDRVADPVGPSEPGPVRVGTDELPGR